MAIPRSAFLAKIGQQAGEKGRASKYDPAHCDTIRALAQQGKFPETWACTIGVSVETLRRWGHRYPEFKDALIMGQHLLSHYWTEKVAEGIDNPNANSAMYAIMLRRLPALFGKEPVDLTEYVLREDKPIDMQPAGALTEEQVRAAPTDVLLAELEALRKRREAEKG